MIDSKNETVVKYRERFIGGSDIPIIMGISPFKTRTELLQEKAGLHKSSFTGNEYTKYGNQLEPMIREHINTKYRTDDPFHEDCFTSAITGMDGGLGVRCNVDGVNSGEVLEIKTTSQIKNRVDEYKTYLVQLLFYMLNTNKAYGMLAVYERTDFIVPASINEDKLQIFTIKLTDYKTLIGEIAASVESFKQDLILLKQNPNLSEEDLIDPVIVANTKKVIELEDRLKAMRHVEEELKTTKQSLFDAMRKYGVKKWRTLNGVTISRVDETETIRTVLDTDALREEHPDMYEKYSITKTSKRKGYVRISFDKNPHLVVEQEFKIEKDNK